MLKTYEAQRPFEIERTAAGPNEGDWWTYVLRITEQTDPMLATMIGDVVHNLRSAFDHFVVDTVPANRRSKAFFPISHQDIFEKDDEGNYVSKDEQARKSFESAIEGVPILTGDMIRAGQPYVVADFGHSPLGLISRMENADKHRQLLPVVVGIRLSVLTYVSGWLEHQAHAPGYFARDGGIVSKFRQAVPVLSEDEVKVTVSGIPHVSFELPPLSGVGPAEKFEVLKTLFDALRITRKFLTYLEISRIYDPAGTHDLLVAMGVPDGIAARDR